MTGIGQQIILGGKKMQEKAKEIIFENAKLFLDIAKLYKKISKGR